MTFIYKLYQEHLEEAAFLYEQHRVLKHDRELSWKDLEAFENRYEAHLDALVLGEGTALELCLAQAVDGECGELHTAVRLFCRNDRLELIQQVIEQIDSTDQERLAAVQQALCIDLPQNRHSTIVALLQDNPGLYSSVLPKVIGYLRLNGAQALLNALQSSPMDVYADILWALGRLKTIEAKPVVLKLLEHKDEMVSAGAALALLRLGQSLTLTTCFNKETFSPWLMLAIGLEGNQKCLSVMISQIKERQYSDDCNIALGLLGDVSAVEPLLTIMADAKLAESAALGLHLITGADLYEEGLVPEEIDADEFFDEEIDPLQKGELLYPSDGPPFETMSRLSLQPEAWRLWWAEHRNEFKADVCYRHGKPYGPCSLIESMASEKSPRIVRQIAYEEMVIHYGMDVPFEIDMPVQQQINVLTRYGSVISKQKSAFSAGRRYFAGRLV